MNGVITRIDDWKRGSNGRLFCRVYFAMSDGNWAKTDLVKEYANFSKWKSLLKTNIEVGGLQYAKHAKTTINADCSPYFIRRMPPPETPIQPELFT